MYLHVTVCFGRRVPCSRGDRVSHWEARGELGPRSHSGGFPGGALLTGTCSIFSCRREIGLEVVLVSFSLRKLTRLANRLIENETGKCTPQGGPPEGGRASKQQHNSVPSFDILNGPVSF